MKQRGCAISVKLKRAIIVVFNKKIKQIIFRLPDAAGKEKAKSRKTWLMGRERFERSTNGLKVRCSTD